MHILNQGEKSGLRCVLVLVKNTAIEYGKINNISS